MSMRVTNSMINMHSKTNINNTKQLSDIYNTQMTTHKRIDKPSDDPVVAIRSLRLRDSLGEVAQYTEKNIPDAESWLSVTETSMKKMSEVFKDVYALCENGATGTLTTEDRNTIIKNLSAYVSQIYAEGDTEYAGRTVFTGYKTNKTLCFPANDTTSSYEITQHLKASDISEKYFYSNKLNLPADDASMFVGAYPELSDEIKEASFSRIRLAYDSLEEISDPPTITANPSITGLTVKTITMADFEASDYTFTGANIYFLKDSGELVLNQDALDLINAAKTVDPDLTLDFSYKKTGFQKGEVRPEMYFDCKDLQTGVLYEKERQEICYTVSANFELSVNLQAGEDGILTTNIARDIDELLDAVTLAQNAADKVERIKTLKTNANFQSDDDQKKIAQWLEAARKEETYLTKNLQGLLSKGMTKFQNYKQTTDLAITDVGSRSKRLELTKTRMESQQSTIKTLIHTNEDRELSDILIDYKAAYEAYQSSLTAASKVSDMTLLDYL